MGLKGVFEALASKKNLHLRDKNAWALSFYENIIGKEEARGDLTFSSCLNEGG